MPLLGGVRPPLAMLLCLLLAVAAAVVVGVSRVGSGGVPSAVQDAERDIAQDAADDLRGSIKVRAETLRENAAAFAESPAAAKADPAAALKRLAATSSGGKGAVLLDARSGSLLADSGEKLPVSTVHTALRRHGSRALAPILAHTGQGPRLLYFAHVTPKTKNGSRKTRRWLLAQSDILRPPTVHGKDRSVHLLFSDGRSAASSGSAESAPSASSAPTPEPSASGIQRRAPAPANTAAPLAGDDHALTARAAAAAASSGAAGPDSGNLLGASTHAGRTVAGWATVDRDDLHLVVMTYRTAKDLPAAAPYTAFAAKAALLLVLVTLVVWLLLWLTVQRPLLRLHVASSRLATAVASGDPRDREILSRPVRTPRYGEPKRIGRALEALRRQLADEDGRPAASRPGPGLRALVTLCALLLAGWSLPLIGYFNQVQASSAVPQALVNVQQARTQTAADRVRRSLEQAATELGTVSPRLAGKSSDRGKALRSFHRHHGRFRSVYLVDGSGRIVERAGDRPRRTTTSAATGTGIVSVTRGGKIPTIAAHVPVTERPENGRQPAPATQLYGELDEDRIDHRLQGPHLGDAYLADGTHHVIAAGVGFRAYQALPGDGLAELAAGTRAADADDRHPVSTVVGGGRRGITSRAAVAAAAPLAGEGPTSSLDWNVVTTEPAQALRITEYRAQWRTMLVGILGLTVTAACLGWLHIVVVRPARALAELAERLADGDRRTVLYPVHHDEVGSVTRNFERIRQALTGDRRGTASSRGAPAGARSGTGGTPSTEQDRNPAGVPPDAGHQPIQPASWQ